MFIICDKLRLQQNKPLSREAEGTDPVMPGNLRFARCQFLRENRKMRLSENEPSGISGRLFCGMSERQPDWQRG